LTGTCFIYFNTGHRLELVNRLNTRWNGWEEITPSIEIAIKIAGALNLTVDYLITHPDNMVMNKNLLRRIEDREVLSIEKKDKVYYFIDMALA